jgi:putative sigma-54 modulation protein
MQVVISFKHMDPSDTLKAFIQEKSKSLEKYFEGKIAVNWVLSQEKFERIAHCHLVGNHMDYYGDSMAENFMSSIELTLDKIEKQIRKHKEILTDHHHKAGRSPIQSDSE